MDMMMMALACDLTGVGSLQWSDTEAKHTFPWLNLSRAPPLLPARRRLPARPSARRSHTWYSEMHAYLLKAMQAVDMGGHSLLDETVIFFGTEIADPAVARARRNMPFMLAGGDGKTMKTGRWSQVRRRRPTTSCSRRS